jgi:hypothetical protein
MSCLLQLISSIKGTSRNDKLIIMQFSGLFLCIVSVSVDFSYLTEKNKKRSQKSLPLLA